MATSVRKKRAKATKPVAPKKHKVNIRRLEALKIGLAGSGCCGLGIFNGMASIQSAEDAYGIRALITKQPPSKDPYSPRVYFYNYSQVMLTVTDPQLKRNPDLKEWLERAGFKELVSFPTVHSETYMIHMYSAPPLDLDEFELVIPDIPKAEPSKPIPSGLLYDQF
jgi:hypothetical protein